MSDTAAKKAPKSYFGNGRIVRGVSTGGLRARCTVACYLALTMCSSVVAAANQPDAQLYDISISVLNAAKAINRLAEQTGAILLYPYDLVKSRQTKPVVGRYTLIDALNRLLQGSGLSSGLSNKGVIKIFLDEETERDNKGRAMNQQKPIKPSIFKKIAGIFLAGLLGAPSAGAQQAETGTGGILEEIIVTAQKRAENLQDIALSITALTPDTLARGGITRLSRLELLVPGMNLSQSGNDPRVAMRGVRTEGVLVGQDPAFAFYADGIYRSRTYQAMASIVDVERVEVLRGPQGTLSGRNSYGGAINIISNKPDASAFDFATDVTLGEYGRVRNDGFINLPFGDGSAFRLSWVKDSHDGKIENIIDGQPDIRDRDEDYLRGQVSFEVSDNFDVRLAGSYWSSDGNGNADFGHHFAGVPRNAAGVADSQGTLVPEPFFLAGDIDNITDPFKIAGNGPFLQDNDQYTFDAEFNWDVGFANVKFLFGYADMDRIMCTDGDFSPLPGIAQCEIDFVEAFTEEITITSQGDGPFKWTVGAFFLQDEAQSVFTFDQLFDFCGSGTTFGATCGFDNFPVLTEATLGPQDFSSLNNVETDSFAFYGQASYRFAEQFEITAGVRYTEDDKDYRGGSNFNELGPVVGTVFDPVFQGPGRTDDASFDETTWMASGSWFASDDVMAYVKASTGFISGGFNSGPHPVTGEFDFGPQTVDAYEFGFKATLLDGTMIFNLAAFRNDYEDLLAQSFIVVGASLEAVNANAGGAETTGVEIEIDWYPTANLYLSVRANWIDSEYQDFVLGGDGFADTNVTDPVTGTVTSIANLDGKQIQNTPDVTLNFTGSYEFSMGESGTLRPQITVYYSDEYPANDRGRPAETQDSYTTVDLRLFWESVDEHWVAEAFVENAGDEEILQRSVHFGGGTFAQDFKDPRTWGVRLGYRY